MGSDDKDLTTPEEETAESETVPSIDSVEPEANMTANVIANTLKALGLTKEASVKDEDVEIEGDIELPINFFSKRHSHTIVMNDREVVYKGNKEIETHTSTRIKFEKGKYLCTEPRIYNFLINCSAFTNGIIMLSRIAGETDLGPAIKFTQSMLSKMSRDELGDIANQLGVIVTEQAGKKDVVDAILAKQKGASTGIKVPKPTASKGALGFLG